MIIWRMSFRCGNQGDEMWPYCRDLQVAAITYDPLIEVDLSKYPQGKPEHLWAQLTPTQKASLRRVGYEMKQGDIIYVKQGQEIVGRGVIQGSYQFDYEHRLLDHVGIRWNHQVSVNWESTFEPIPILLGAEPVTVLKLSGERLRKLEVALSNQAYIRDEDITSAEEITEGTTFYEGAKQQITVNVYERNLEARRRCLAHFGTKCSVCEFDFSTVYGEVGEGFIHVHHLTEISQIGKEYQIDPIHDLRPVCPNCHAIIHRRKPAYSIEDVRKFLSQKGG